jgi:hypothetical protein
MLRERDRRIRGRKKALRHFKSSSVALRNEILQRPNAIDDYVRLSVDQRVKRFRQVLIFCVMKLQFVEVLRARGPRYRVEPRDNSVSIDLRGKKLAAETRLVSQQTKDCALQR